MNDESFIQPGIAESCIDLRKRFITSPHADVVYLHPFIFAVLKPLAEAVPSQHLPLWLECSHEPGKHNVLTANSRQTLAEYRSLPLLHFILDGRRHITAVAKATDYPDGAIAYVQLDDGNYIWTCVPKEI